MKKKFGRYTINVADKKCKKRTDGNFDLEVTLSGCIEIGLEIESHTWRADWLLKLFFGDNYSDYELVSLENNDNWTNKTIVTEVNTVRAVVRKRTAGLW